MAKVEIVIGKTRLEYIRVSDDVAKEIMKKLDKSAEAVCASEALIREEIIK